jgi:hypothetical protein
MLVAVVSLEDGELVVGIRLVDGDLVAQHAVDAAGARSLAAAFVKCAELIELGIPNGVAWLDEPQLRRRASDAEIEATIERNDRAMRQ